MFSFSTLVQVCNLDEYRVKLAVPTGTSYKLAPVLRSFYLRGRTALAVKRCIASQRGLIISQSDLITFERDLFTSQEGLLTFQRGHVTS
jgi:hypothetical protein